MSKNLPMAINPSVNYDNNFQLIELPNNQDNHFLLRDFVIEVNTKTISEDIALFLGISHEWCTTYIGGDQNFTHCQYPSNGFHGHMMRYRGITLEQLQVLWVKAKNARSDKYKPILSELILTQVLPLFNQSQQLIKHDDFKKETIVSTNLSTENQSQKFHSDLFGDLTVLTHADGSLWFLAEEVITKLGYDLSEITYHKYVYRHCDESDYQESNLDLTGYNSYLRSKTQKQHGNLKPRSKKTLIISESGLYSLIFSSPLPEAKEFKRWVTKDILPSIRKTGGYGQIANKQADSFMIDDPVQRAERWIAEQKEKSALQLEMKQIETQIAEDKPYTNLGKIIGMTDATILIGHYSTILQNDHNVKIGQNRLFGWMRENGYLCKEVHQKNRPTQRSMEMGLFKFTERPIPTNHGIVIEFTPRLTNKGQLYFLDKLTQHFSPAA